MRGGRRPRKTSGKDLEDLERPRKRTSKTSKDLAVMKMEDEAKWQITNENLQRWFSESKEVLLYDFHSRKHPDVFLHRYALYWKRVSFVLLSFLLFGDDGRIGTSASRSGWWSRIRSWVLGLQ